MTSRLYDEMDIRRALKAACRDFHSHAVFAFKAKVSSSYITDVLKGSRPPGDKIARALGFDRVTRYIRKTPSKGTYHVD